MEGVRWGIWGTWFGKLELEYFKLSNMNCGIEWGGWLDVDGWWVQIVDTDKVHNGKDQVGRSIGKGERNGGIVDGIEIVTNRVVFGFDVRGCQMEVEWTRLVVSELSYISSL